MPERVPDPLLDVPASPGSHRTTVDEAFLDRVYDAQQTLAILRSRPLLGPDRHAATERVRQVAAVLQELPDDLASADLFGLAGDLALDLGHGEAVDRYLRGAAAARRRADPVRERDLHLRACRAVARMRGPEAATAFFSELGRPSPEPCPATLHLTQAELDPHHARDHLEAALAHLDTAARAHDRIMALEDLAETLVRGNEPLLALPPLAEALALAERWGDDGHAAHVHAMRASIYLVSGQAERAIPCLRAALDGAIGDEDDLLTVTHGTVLAGLLIDRAAWTEAETVARRILTAAERRGHWIAVADAALAWSTTFAGRDQPGAGIAVLARTLVTLRSRGATGAAALLHARLGELRSTMGASTFDPLLKRVMTALRGTR